MRVHWLCAAVMTGALVWSPIAGAQTAPAAAGQEQPVDTLFTAEELQTLLKPVALYPDVLLAQMLPAAAYPLEIVQAARWLERNKAAVAKNDFSAADAMNWDPSVKAMLRFPDIIKRMNEDLDWTSDLGDAFVNQPKDVADTIQALRAAAETTGALKSTQQQKVVRRSEGPREVIIIEPADPEVIFVPVYDQSAVFSSGYGNAVAAGVIGFGAGVVVGSLINNNSWNWGIGAVYPPVWPGYPGYRPGRPGGINTGNINIGNDINIGNGNGNLIGNTKPWRPDADRYRPGQGTKPGLANPNRPGGPGGVGRPGGVGDLGRPGGPGGAGGVGRPGGPGGPGNISRPGGPGDIGRPGGPGTGRPDVGRPGGGGAVADRPKPSTRPATPAKPQATRPQARPAPANIQRPSTTFGGIESGRGAAQFGNRGAASRQQMSRPGGGGGGMARPSPAPRPQVNRGGGGGGRAVGGGGGRGGGGGGRGR